MKAVFITLATLAASVFAAPSVATGGIVSAETIASSDILLSDTAIYKRSQTIKTADDLASLISEGYVSIKTNTGALNATTADVKAGRKTKSQGQAEATIQLKELNTKLANLLRGLRNVKSVTTTDHGLQGLLHVIYNFVVEVFSTIVDLLTTLGLGGPIVDIVHSALALVAGILATVFHLVGDIAGPLLQILDPLLDTISHGILEPVFSAVVHLLRSIFGSY